MTDLILPGAKVLLGDCIARMKDLPDQSVQMCVTSPPYFGLRDYGTGEWQGGDADCDHVVGEMRRGLGLAASAANTRGGAKKVAETADIMAKAECPKCGAKRVDQQIGLEDTPEAFIAKLVEVFREVRRVLADDGTLWVNIGDSYASKPNGPAGGGGQKGDAPHVAVRTANARRSSNIPDGLKHKDLIGIPWMLAFALRADGAASPAHMRLIEEVISTVTASYEFREQWPDRIAALVERLEREQMDANRGGWYLRQEIIWHKPNPMPESVTDRCTKAHESLFLLAKSPRYFFDSEAIKEPAVSSAPPGNKTHRGQDAYEGGNEHHRTKGGLSAFAARARSAADSFKREGSKRSIVIPGQNAGTHRPDREESSYDVTKRNRRSVWSIATRPYKGAHFAVFPPALVEPCILAGSRPGDVVLDPFNGSGTTGAVAIQHGRQYVGTELNPEYLPLTRERLESAISAREENERAEAAKAAEPKQLSLIEDAA